MARQKKDNTEPFRVSQAHFKIFKKAVYDWVDNYGLKEWLITISLGLSIECMEHFNNPPEAVCEPDLDAMQANIALNDTWPNEPTRERLKEAAFHEVTELLLAPMNILASERYTTEDQIDQARHAIIQRLYNVVAQDKYRRKPE